MTTPRWNQPAGPRGDTYALFIIKWYYFQKNVLLLKAYPLQDVAAQMPLRNRWLSSATLLDVVIVTHIYIYAMSFSHIYLGFTLLLFPAAILCAIVFSKQLYRVTGPSSFQFFLQNVKITHLTAYLYFFKT